MHRFHPIARFAEETAFDDLKVAVVSDLHIGSSSSRYAQAWKWLMQGIKQGQFNRLVINGDFACYQEMPSRELTARLRQHLQEALDANPELKIYMVRGNHDMARPFHNVLQDLARSNPARFTISDILFFGEDVAFIHGDRKMLEHERHIFPPIYFRNQAARDAKTLSNAGKPPKPWCVPVDKCLGKIPEIDRMFTLYTEPHYDLGAEPVQGHPGKTKRVFIGHIHPEEPMMDIPCNGRKYYVTGASLVGGECTIIGLQFNADGTSKEPEIVYHEPMREMIKKERAYA
ncbi:MAG: metallophosphoesterase [Rickettsiales bacterium]